MQSLSDLNNYGAQTIDVTDDRDTQIIFTGPAGDAEFTTYEGIPVYIKDALGVEIEDIVDYANLGMEVELELLAPFPVGIELLFKNKPDYITITEVGATATITGFRSVADWLWLKNNVYFNKDVDWFGTFEYTVTVHNNISAPDRTFTATITVLELRYFTTPSAYNYPYTSSGYTAYPDWTIDGLDATTDGNYQVEIQAVGSHSANLAGARSTSSAGTYSYNAETLTLTMNTNNKADMESMVAGVEFDFNSKQYPMEFEIFVQDQSFNSFAGDYEIQTVYSDDDTILSDGTEQTHSNTSLTIGSDSPLFNTGLTGTGDLIADITAFDLATVTNIIGPTIPIADSGLTSILSETSATSTVDDIITCDDGSRVLVQFRSADNLNYVYYRLYEWTSGSGYSLAFTLATDNIGYYITYKFLSYDGDTVIWVEKNNLSNPTSWKLRTAKYSGGSWTTYTAQTFSSELNINYINDDGTVIGYIVTTDQPTGVNLLYEWNSGTNQWDSLSTTGTQFENSLTSSNLFPLAPGGRNGDLAGNGTVYAELANDGTINVYRWNGANWQTYNVFTRFNSDPNASALDWGMSGSGDKIVGFDRTETPTTSVYAYHWNSNTNSYDEYDVADYTELGGGVSPYEYIEFVGPDIDENGDVYIHMANIGTTPNNFVYLHNFSEGYSNDNRLQLSETTYDASDSKFTVAYDGDIIHRLHRDNSGDPGPNYDVYLGSEVLLNELNTLNKRIVIRADSIASMNFYLQNVEIVPAGTDDIVLVYKVTAPDGSTTEKIYTIGYA